MVLWAIASGTTELPANPRIIGINLYFGPEILKAPRRAVFQHCFRQPGLDTVALMARMLAAPVVCVFWKSVPRAIRDERWAYSAPEHLALLRGSPLVPGPLQPASDASLRRQLLSLQRDETLARRS